MNMLTFSKNILRLVKKQKTKKKFVETVAASRALLDYNLCVPK